MGSAGKWDRPVSGIGRYVESAVGCRNKLTIAGLAFLLTMLESVQVKAPRITTGGSDTQTLLVAAQVDALDVSGNSLLDDSIPYFAEVRGWRCVRRQAHMRACVRAGVSACAHTRADVPSRPGRPHARFGPRIASLRYIVCFGRR